jgi:hypothetical protein
MTAFAEQIRRLGRAHQGVHARLSTGYARPNTSQTCRAARGVGSREELDPTYDRADEVIE